MKNGWREMDGCPIGEMGSGESFRCLVIANGEITIGQYGEGWLFGDWRWIDPRGWKIEPIAWQELPDWP